MQQIRAGIFKKTRTSPSGCQWPLTQGCRDTFYIDEVFVKIRGKRHYLWRAVNQDGEVVDGYLQTRCNGAAAKRFFKRLLKVHRKEPRKIITDILRSYGVAH